MPDNLRQQKGLEIAARYRLTNQNGLWLVPSQSRARKQYRVDPEAGSCTCPDYEFTAQRCKHQYAVEYVIQRETTTTTATDAEGVTTTTTVTTEKVTRKTYPQNWPAYHAAQVNEKSQFLALLYELCQSVDEPIQTFGRPRASLADIIFGVVFRTYSTFSGRRFSGDLREAEAQGFVSRMPSYNSLFDYLKMESMTPHLKQLIELSSLPLKSVETDFAVDSSGFSAGNNGRWFDAKYGEKDIRGWIKLHLMCGVKTNIVTSVEATNAAAADSKQFGTLVDRTVENGFNLREVSADKAYLGKENFATVLRHGATPYIPFKSNSRADINGPIWERLYHFYSFQRDEFMRQYHKRSNVETTISMIKAKFGERLRCKTPTAQINEALCKVLAHNICCVIQSMYELGIDPAFEKPAYTLAC